MDLFNNKNQPELKIKLPNKIGYSYTYSEKLKLFLIKVPNGELLYSENFFNEKISNRSMDYFLENKNKLDWKSTDWKMYEKEKLSNIKFSNILWQHDKIKMFGKEIFLPRYSAWYGDNDKPYTYSGLTLYPKPWNKGLEYLKDEIDKVSKIQYNSVLMNWYRDGNDYINWHTDAEKELGKNPVIGSLNFGATRRFLIRRIDNHKEKIELPLKHGTLLVMKGELQHYWQHSVPKEKKVSEDRINLTFRIINHKK